jgi:hypothetical protein
MKGYDPYDALTGTRVPSWVHSRPRARQVLVQVRKRVPFNLAPLLGIEPRLIAKALACFLTAEARLEAAGVAATSATGGTPPSGALASGARFDRARELVALIDQAAGNCGGGAWGYEFDAQLRWGFYGAGTPNLVATVFCGRGFAEAAATWEVPEWEDRAREAARYLVDKQLRKDGAGRPFFAYTPDSPRLIHNANFLGAGFVAAAGARFGMTTWPTLALEAAATSLAAQRPDGSWPYGEGSNLGWSDNFHTAYNLDSLIEVWLATGDAAARAALELGVAHWARDFFGPSGEPKYYPSKPLPYDIHSAATAVDLAARLATWGFATGDLARRVATWTRANLVDPHSGHTYFQKHRLFTDKRAFVRWGDAHWALAEASLALLGAGRRSPFEESVKQRSANPQAPGDTRQGGQA